MGLAEGVVKGRLTNKIIKALGPKNCAREFFKLISSGDKKIICEGFELDFLPPKTRLNYNEKEKADTLPIEHIPCQNLDFVHLCFINNPAA